MPKARHSSAGNSFFSFCRFFRVFLHRRRRLHSRIQDSRFQKKRIPSLKSWWGKSGARIWIQTVFLTILNLESQNFCKVCTVYGILLCKLFHHSLFFRDTQDEVPHICICTHTHMYTHTYTYTQVALHYIALHCIALHYATLRYSTLHYTTLHYITLHYIALHCIALHCIAYIYIYKPGYHRYRNTCKTWRFWQQGVLGGRRTSVEPRTKNQDYTESFGEIGSWFLVWWRS